MNEIVISLDMTYVEAAKAIMEALAKNPEVQVRLEDDRG